MAIPNLTVTQLNTYIKSVFDSDPRLQYVLVNGEISDYKVYTSSGHVYFTLKDNQTTVKCVMFSSSASRLRFKPKDGMSVVVMGRVSVYEQRGMYQLYVESMQAVGVGTLSAAYEQLKNRLAAKGVFDESRKRPVPLLPRRIGVVTSPTGAVIQDIKNVVSRRCPLTEIVLYPSAVQGAEAAAQLADGVRYFNKEKNVDVIIIGRGGGSFEELNAFNDESLIWAIYDSSIPIISAVGHETDFTLCDFASDLRAPTPSAAAEMAVPDSSEMRKSINAAFGGLVYKVSSLLHSAYQETDRLNDIVEKCSPDKRIDGELEDVLQFKDRMSRAVQNTIMLEKAQLNAAVNGVNANSPMNLLQKGYSYATKRGKCVTSAESLKKGDTLTVRFADGTADCTVTQTKLFKTK